MASKRSDIWVHPSEREKKTSPEEDIEMLRYIFELVEKMVNCKEYDKDLQDELTSAFPNFMIVLQTAKRDLLRNDCGIVVAGETSAGKTSVINWIVGKSVFVTSNAAATGTVCRIRNSQELQIKAYTKEEKLKRDEHPNDMKRFKSIIRTLTDVEKITADMKDLFYVDAYLPVPLLQGNVILVDTPGIGESDDLDKILLEFLPHAVSFMFIINANNAGGVCDDRLIKILRNIMDNRSKMPCFNTEDVMFLTNKWDSIEIEEYRSPSEEEEEEEEEDNVDRENQHDKTFRIINSKLMKGWPHINPKNIFRISMKQMQRGITSEFTEDYKRFEDVLIDTIYKNKNKRVEFYFCFIQNFIRNAERGTLARLVLLEKSENDQIEYIKKNKEDIGNLEIECIKRKKEMEEYRKNMVRELAEKLHKYLNSYNGKEKILNPIDEKPIQSIAYRELGEEVKHRIERGIQKWCESDEVKSILNNADARIQSLVKDMETQMQGIEHEMLGIYHRDYSRTRTFFVGLGVGLSIAFFPFAWIFPVVFTMILNPIMSIVDWLMSADKCRRKAEDLYDKCVKELDVETIHKHFEESFGTQFDKVLEQLFNDEIPKKLETLSKTNDKLLEDYNNMRKKEGALLKLKVMIDKIQKEVENFREITKW